MPEQKTQAYHNCLLTHYEARLFLKSPETTFSCNICFLGDKKKPQNWSEYICPTVCFFEFLHSESHRVSNVLLVTALEKLKCFAAVGEKSKPTVRAARGIRPPCGQQLTHSSSLRNKSHSSSSTHFFSQGSGINIFATPVLRCLVASLL